jgi:hypothetical protein
MASTPNHHTRAVTPRVARITGVHAQHVQHVTEVQAHRTHGHSHLIKMLRDGATLYCTWYERVEGATGFRAHLKVPIPV